MKKSNIFFLVLVLVFSASCYHIPGTTANIESKQTEAKYEKRLVISQLEERSKQLNTASKDLLVIVPEEQRSPNEIIAVNLLTENERIIGSPIEALDVEILLKKFAEDNANLIKDLNKIKNNNTLLLKEKNGLEIEIDKLTEELQSRDKGFFGNIMSWFWGLSISGMILVTIGLIVCAVLCPTLIPRIIGWFVIKVPQLIGFIGITSIKVVDSVIDSVQDIRVTLSKYNDDDVIPIKEVKNLIDSKLNSRHDKDVKDLIEHRKKKRHVIRTNKN